MNNLLVGELQATRQRRLADRIPKRIVVKMATIKITEGVESLGPQAVVVAVHSVPCSCFVG
jgi:hypothetical protein